VSRWGSAAAAAMMLLGLALRLRPYLANRSLWMDESFLALNIMERSFGQLTQPLDHLQGVPHWVPRDRALGHRAVRPR
jgi:hypothetical protein